MPTLLSYVPCREIYSPWHLRQFLITHGLDTSDWFKSIEDLYNTLANQEAELVWIEERLALRVESVRVIVYSPDKTLVLEIGRAHV